MSGKICCTCKEYKPYDQFCKDKSVKDGYYRMCKECKKPYSKSRSKNGRDVIWNIKSNTSCKDCGLKFHPAAMDFDHLDSNTKISCVGNMKMHNEKTILEEIAKCDVVCSNCHRIRTYNRKIAK